MIVCHSRRFVFVHLHKTAGTSVKDSLKAHLALGDIVIGDSGPETPSSLQPDNRLHLLKKHSSAQSISKVVGEEVWSFYFKFCFVRHPFDRLVSLYEFFNRVRCNNAIQPGFLSRIFSLGQRNRRLAYPDKPPWNWPGMQAFLTTSDFSGFIRSGHLDKDQGANPQARSVTDKSGKLLVDFVGKVETIADDWQTICNQLGIQQALVHKNESEKRFGDVRRYWNDDDLQYASEKYRQDFEMFGYSPDSFS